MGEWWIYMGKIQKILTDEDFFRLEYIMPSATIIFNLEEVVFVNHAFRKIVGYDFNTLKKIKLKEFIVSGQKRVFLENIIKLIKWGTEETEFEIKIKCSNSIEKWVECRAKGIIYKNKVFIIANIVDITHGKLIQNELSNLLTLRDAMLEVTHSIVKADSIDSIYELILKNAVKSIRNAKLGTILLKDGNYLRMASQTGFDAESISDFKIPLEQSFIYKLTDGKLDEIKKIDNLSKVRDFMKIKAQNKESQYIKSTLTAPIYINGDFFGTVNIDSTDINAFDKNDIKVMEFIKNNVEIAISNHLLYEEKLQLSKYDSLTKLYNRYYFEEIFEHIKKRALRYNEEFNIAVFDINDLKIINDNFGHIAGDLALKYFAKNCIQIIRKSDVLARYGGDEFIGIFLNSNKDLLNKRLKEYLDYLKENPLRIEEKEIFCSFSYGIAAFAEDGTNLSDLVKAADKRMYEFKRNYKSKINYGTKKERGC